MKRRLLGLAALVLVMANTLAGCAAEGASQGSAMDRQKEIEEGNAKLGNVKGTQD